MYYVAKIEGKYRYINKRCQNVEQTGRNSKGNRRAKRRKG